MKGVKGCGDPECAVSTGICGTLTFGKGELDDNGYWEYPCDTCAQEALATFGTLDTESDAFRLSLKDRT